MVRTLLLSVLLTISFSDNTYAQLAAAVTGIVKEAGTGRELIRANILLKELERGITSDDAGKFSISRIKPGVYTLICSYMGYEPFQTEITVSEGETLLVDVELIPKSHELSEIEVRSVATDNRISKARVNTEFIQILPSFVEADVFRTVQMLPGVQASSDFVSNLYIRGGSPDQTLILLDNTTVYNPTHFFGFFSTFNPDAVQNVELYKGAYPAEFGGRLGSVLSVNNRNGSIDRAGGSLTAGLMFSSISLEGPHEQGSWLFAARRSTLEPILTELRKSMDDIPQDYFFYDINGSANFHTSSKDEITLSMYMGYDRVLFPFAKEAAFNMDYGNHTVSTSWKHRYSQNLSSEMAITGSQYFKVSEFDVAGTTIQRKNQIYDYSLKSAFKYIHNERQFISFGIRAGVSELNLKDQFDGTLTFGSRIQNEYASAYFQNDWRPNEHWLITPGVRVNYYSGGDYLRFEPRLSLEYTPIKPITFQASYGHYNQFIAHMTGESFLGFDVWLTTAEGVEPAYGDQFVWGLKTIPLKNIGLDVELYYRTMNDLFELDPFLPDMAGLPYEDLFRVGEGYAYGLEAILEKKAGKFTGFAGYTLAYTWRKFPGYNTILGSDDTQARFYPPKYDRRHDVNVMASYQLTKKWRVTSSFNYSTGQAYTKVLGWFATIDLPWSYGRQNIFTVGNVNASRLPAYHRLDFAITRSGSFFNIGSSELQLQVINVYSRRNVWFYNYSFDSNPVELIEVNLLPMLPSVSYTIKF